MTLKSARCPAIVVLLVGSFAFGQPQTKTETVTKETKRDGTTTTKTVQKSSEVLGRPITINNENIGKVEDLVVDVNTGRVVYGVGSFTTVKDSSGKLYAYPWPAGTYSTTTRTYDLDMDTARLQGAPSFTTTTYPNFTDDEFVTRTYKTYNQTPYWQTGSTVVRTADRPGTTHTWTSRPTTVTRVSEIRGRQIRTPDGVVLGPINEVVLEPGSGRILYAVTTRDGQSVPIPWTALRAKDKDFEITIAADRFKTAPVIETDRWSTITDPYWTTQVYKYYEVEPIHDHDDDD